MIFGQYLGKRKVEPVTAEDLAQEKHLSSLLFGGSEVLSKFGHEDLSQKRKKYSQSIDAADGFIPLSENGIDGVDEVSCMFAFFEFFFSKKYLFYFRLVPIWLQMASQRPKRLR